jgi:hypothetical protein
MLLTTISPKDRVYRDAEKIQSTVNKILDRKWDKLVEKQNMSIEEIDHQNWVQLQIKEDPGFLDKSEDVEIPPKKFKYVPNKPKQETEDNASVPPSDIIPSSSGSVAESDHDSASLGKKLRKRKK